MYAVYGTIGIIGTIGVLDSLPSGRVGVGSGGVYLTKTLRVKPSTWTTYAPGVGTAMV